MKELQISDLEWANVLQALKFYAEFQKENLASNLQLSAEQKADTLEKIQTIEDIHASSIELTASTRKGVIIRANV